MVHRFNSRFVATGRYHLIRSTVLVVELQMAWVGIIFAKLRFGAEKLIVEEDLTTMIARLRKQPLEAMLHSLLYNI